MKSTCVAWQSGMYCQAVPSHEPRIGVRCMRCLAAMNNLPGGFWKISKTQHFQSNNTDSAKHIYFQSYNYAINNIRRGLAPLTWIPSLKLNCLRYSNDRYVSPFLMWFPMAIVNYHLIDLYDLFFSYPRLPLNYLGFFPTFHIQFKAKMPKIMFLVWFSKV